MAQIKTSRFQSSHARVDQAPKDGRPEFAFIGRSNVGKSSLINMLTQRKELAHTSGKPGKTQLLNYYLINDSWYLTDLPGYGYAKQSKKTRSKWETRMENYFLKRQSLVSAFVLIDSNVPPQDIDLEFVNWLGEHGIPFVLAFTKTDRRKARDGEHVTAFQERLAEYWEELPPVFLTSANKEIGREEILEYMETALNTVNWAFYADTATS
ncbi:ribosome biogenesis GTP-binding protein YihA/YsxC [Neolewinella litorea]|uniref:Probable GTP-binding protein EngB n=1 Tax=Neolewinella litorea TaxID=2562452 RepID=A0A4S4NSY2_9BACT|nr:ribosome biogenesis GTP-binding protein YihA/YsxC [Neolewinella litorea]THH41581.1 YihA family ribosome biogenesis GTP-binding protein [Neolewinella litorea]